jgi:N-glycosylase/DNA lyase
VRLTPHAAGVQAETATTTADWFWLERYLNTAEDLDAVVQTFPIDAPLQQAISACRGLRLLQQDPWECLASFILSSTKQITQIQQIVERLCTRYGEPLPVPEGHPPALTFPSPARLADTTEAQLRECRMGFRARHLHAAARAVVEGTLDLEALRGLPLPLARQHLTQLPGVGRKIADCVLLFSLGQRQAFPVDVWVARALRAFYFPGRRVTDRELIGFTESHFGPEAGYAQQYLFHYARRNPHLVEPASESDDDN